MIAGEVISFVGNSNDPEVSRPATAEAALLGLIYGAGLGALLMYVAMKVGWMA